MQAQAGMFDLMIYDSNAIKMRVKLEFFKLFDRTNGHKWGGPEGGPANLRRASSHPYSFSSSFKSFEVCAAPQHEAKRPSIGPFYPEADFK
eukprot:1138848-Pelagomonas_calceolata.AAC.5